MVRLRQKTFDILSDNNRYNDGYNIFRVFIISLILFNVFSLCLDSVEAINQGFSMWFKSIDLTAKAVFFVEFILRLWSCVEDRREENRHPVFGRLKFMTQFLSVIDFLAFIPWFLFPINPNTALILELVVILKIIRYSPALKTLGEVLYYERKPVFAALFTMLIVFVFASGVIWVLEKDVQPDTFSSIPASMWWSVATMTTVGYGDIVPLTPAGKMFGGIIAVMGIAMFTLPAGLLAAGFAREIKRKDFMLNFSMVSKVPFFKGLDPERLAQITSVLKQKLVPARFVVIQKGEISNALYFIAKGEMEMDLSHGVVSLGEGEFFGEVSALGGGGIRTASVTSVTESTLLVLKNDDLQKLVDGWPEIKDKLRQAMANKHYNQKKLYESWLENVS